MGVGLGRGWSKYERLDYKETLTAIFFGGLEIELVVPAGQDILTLAFCGTVDEAQVRWISSLDVCAMGCDLNHGFLTHQRQS